MNRELESHPARENTPAATDFLDLAPGVKVFVAGHSGFVGSAIWRRLARVGFTNPVGRSSRSAA